ncbi:MAG: hypothetical protein C0490_20775, partial [Marivirga sp.]|nr:hypothetical protein [Marivirga sp.]
IQPLEFCIKEFTIRDVEYDPQHENGSSTKITPEIIQSADLKDHLIRINIECLFYKEGKICDIKIESKFSLQFLLPYRILNHVSTDFLINIFSQLFLYAQGQLQGVFCERTRGTIFEGCIIHTRFVDSLYLTTKDKLSTV